MKNTISTVLLVLQLTGIFCVVRVLALLTGVKIINIPFVDDGLFLLIEWVSSLGLGKVLNQIVNSLR